MYKQNLHTHCIYCDGKDTTEEMVISAIEKGFQSIGFSSHAYMYWNGHGLKPEKVAEYKAEVRNLAEKYGDKIKIFCGIEDDLLSNVDIDDYDYSIGSVHYMNFDGDICGFDRDTKTVKAYIDNHFDGNGMAFCKKYYELMAELPKYGKYDIIGHFDLCLKLNQTLKYVDECSKEYLGYAFEAARALKGKIPVFEVNTGCISRGYRTIPYPTKEIITEMNRLGFGVCITSDCHDRNFLDCYYPEARELLISCGYKEIQILTDNGFVPEKI